MSSPRRIGIGPRFAVAAIGAVVVAMAIVALGVLVVAAATFTDLMVRHGAGVAESQAMFAGSVVPVFIAAALVAIGVGAALAILLGARLGRSLRAMATAARRIAGGDYDARVVETGPAELADLGASLNRMAESLAMHERERRELIANAAHELRTPLTNIKGYLEALRDGVVPADRVAFVSLLEEADRLVRLSRDLDVLAEGAVPASGEPADLDVAEAVRGAGELALPAFGRADVTLAVDVPEGLLVRAPADDMARVLANLLQNAIRYTPAGGRASVTARATDAAVSVLVENSGPGIPPEDLPRVFERFFRVERSRDRAAGGAGIGLAIVKQLVERSGGSVAVASDASSTVFSFTLPRALPGGTRHGSAAVEESITAATRSGAEPAQPAGGRS